MPRARGLPRPSLCCHLLWGWVTSLFDSVSPGHWEVEACVKPSFQTVPSWHVTNTGQTGVPPPLLLHSLRPAGHSGQRLCLRAQEADVHWGRRLTSTGAGGQQPPGCQRGASVSAQEHALTDSELQSWGSPSPTAGGRLGGGAGTAATARWLPRPGYPDRGQQRGGGQGLPESLMNINEWRREKKINLPDPPMGAAVTI